MLSELPGGTVMDVKVRPCSRCFSVGIRNGIVIIRCKNDARRGKANAEVVRELSGIFGAPVKILAGKTSSRKTVLVTGLDAAKAREILEVSSVKR